MYEYKVDAFVPPPPGCGTADNGWDQKRCQDFTAFLNGHAAEGWKLHSSEFRQVVVQGCSGGKGAWLVCIFERATS